MLEYWPETAHTKCACNEEKAKGEKKKSKIIMFGYIFIKGEFLILSAISVKDLPSEASLLTFKYFMFDCCVLIINYEWCPWMICRSYESFIITKTSLFVFVKKKKKRQKYSKTFRKQLLF